MTSGWRGCWSSNRFFDGFVSWFVLGDSVVIDVGGGVEHQVVGGRVGINKGDVVGDSTGMMEGDAVGDNNSNAVGLDVGAADGREGDTTSCRRCGRCNKCQDRRHNDGVNSGVNKNHLEGETPDMASVAASINWSLKSIYGDNLIVPSK